jgi:hypothetical protein
LSSWLRRSVSRGVYGAIVHVRVCQCRQVLVQRWDVNWEPAVGDDDPRVILPGEDVLFEKAHNFGRRAPGYGGPFHPPGVGDYKNEPIPGGGSRV